MDLIETYLLTLSQEPLLFFSIAFIVMLFAGEPFVLVLSFLVARTNIAPIYYLILMVYLTAIVGELFWFYIAKVNIFNKIKKPKFISRASNELKDLNFSKLRHPLVMLALARVVTALTIVVIIYLSKKKLALKKFILYSMTVNVVWTTLIVGVGYSAGHGYTYALTVFQNTRIVALVSLVSFVLLYIFYKKYIQQRINSFK